MIQEIEARIHPELDPGERLLWSGKPRRGFMFHPASLLLVIMILFVFALVGGLILVNNTLHFVKVIEHLTSGASARVFFTYLISGFFILLGLVALWGFVFYPLERRKTTYALTDRRAIIVSGLFKQKAKSFDLKTMNFTALTQPVKGKATIIFGQVDPDQYGAADPEQKQSGNQHLEAVWIQIRVIRGRGKQRTRAVVLPGDRSSAGLSLSKTRERFTICCGESYPSWRRRRPPKSNSQKSRALWKGSSSGRAPSLLSSMSRTLWEARS